ncbi:diaminopimelate epimerase [Euzebyella saccharophila]|uniref:Diaminopimelate epimerase n=1 Tax=Euzebyella saccharophila TaxID=679664 RepID=A0ABV8JTQ9_9FLAO|nr:diaminopimelate epimerase [Euzebyella saccharophila]
MLLTFYKYQGTGNDFVMIDNRSLNFPKKDTKLVASLCDRRFGIGADGLILLENDEMSDFNMVYYNADGNEGSLCGNGGRCTIAFAKYLGIIENETTFNAVDGLHNASIDNELVSLQMQDLSDIKMKPNYVFLNTGSPHHVQMVKNIQSFDVFSEGKKLRYGLYGQSGSNINFVESISDDEFAVRTYERGVEDETLSCGTGVTAAALAMHHQQKTTSSEVKIKAQGGNLKVKFSKDGDTYRNIYLTGPAKQVFKGEITI